MKVASLYAMAIVYTAAGIYHFIQPQFYKRIMPPWLSWHMELIYLTGVLEIAFGLLLIPLQTRKFASYCIMVLLVLVFPANIQMMLNYYHEDNPLLWIAILRLPLQVLLIWWAYFFTRPVTKDVNQFVQ